MKYKKTWGREEVIGKSLRYRLRYRKCHIYFCKMKNILKIIVNYNLEVSPECLLNGVRGCNVHEWSCHWQKMTKLFVEAYSIWSHSNLFFKNTMQAKFGLLFLLPGIQSLFLSYSWIRRKWQRSGLSRTHENPEFLL